MRDTHSASHSYIPDDTIKWVRFAVQLSQHDVAHELIFACLDSVLLERFGRVDLAVTVAGSPAMTQPVSAPGAIHAAASSSGSAVASYGGSAAVVASVGPSAIPSRHGRR